MTKINRSVISNKNSGKWVHPDFHTFAHIIAPVGRTRSPEAVMVKS